MRITRPSWKRPYEILATPLSGRMRETLSRSAVAALFITDPEDEPATPEGLLADLYGLTRPRLASRPHS